MSRPPGSGPRGPLPPRTLATAGYVAWASLPRGPSGRALCRYCGAECPAGNRRTFCGGAKARFARHTGEIISDGAGCVHEHCVRSQPGYARRCVWARDRGRCALCGTTRERRGAWAADHTLPVAEGGGSCGLDNLRTLCSDCHRGETAKLAARRAAARAAPDPARRPPTLAPKASCRPGRPGVAPPHGRALLGRTAADRRPPGPAIPPPGLFGEDE